MSIHGWLIVNNFINLKKFDEIYALLLHAAKRANLSLAIKRTGDLLCEVGGLHKFSLPDFVLFWDKDTVLASRLEDAGVPVFNCAAAVAACDSKIRTAVLLDKHGIPAPKTVIAPKTFESVNYCDDTFIERAAELLGLPMVIKEAYGSFGKQVYLAHTPEEGKKIVGTLGYKEFLMQEFIATSKGRDLRVNVVGGRVLCAMTRSNPSDFRSNLTIGGTAKQVTPTKEECELAIQACEALQADFAGVDILYGKEGPLLCEVNSNPHFKSTLDCTGMDISHDILAWIAEKLR